MNLTRIHLTKFLLFVLLFYIYSTSIVAQGFNAIESKEGIEITENGRKVLFYQVKPKSLNGKYERAGYVHPLYDLNGNILTEDFPADHPYHHGIFWAWHQIKLRGHVVADGWVADSISWNVTALNLKKDSGRISLFSEVSWNIKTGAGKSTPLVREETVITVYSENEKQRIIDFDIVLYPLFDSISIGGSDDVKGYGGFCMRLRLPADIEFVSNDTLVTPSETAIRAGKSMDFRASFDGPSLPKSGVTLITMPIEKDPQQSWILRKETSMQNIVYPGRTPVPLSRRGLRMKYQLVLHPID